MDTKYMDLLQKEAIRLLDFQCTLLRKLMATPGLLKDASTQDKSSLTFQRAREDMRVLEGERVKLQELDMVLAVVGTINSGKSTTNNAIVGLEVLPNRNRPMTALPTMIRHTPGAQSPELSFQKHGQLNKLIKELKEKLGTPEGQKLLKKADQREDLVKLAENICAGYRIDDRYKNEHGIFEFLKSLNDLVRLSTALDVEFPFEEFKSIRDLPVIEVEFQHLRNNGLGYGRLSLLDTPGPNEEGQFAFKPMIKEQLRRASGVIAILDYTQLKSESDAELRRELLEIAEVSRGRLSILVNKFDNKDRHSDDAKAVKDMVANELMKGCVSAEDVYPVSAKNAYLAHRARTELEVKGNLSSCEELWVEDFAKIGLGHRWQHGIDDVEIVNEAIDYLWEESQFDKLLTHVIQKAHSQAAVMAIDSAAAKLVESGNWVNNFLGLRETVLQKSKEGLQKSEEELQKKINNLQHQIALVVDLEERSRMDIQQYEKQLKDDMAIAVNQAERDLCESLEMYFQGQDKIEFSSELSAQQLLDKIYNATGHQYLQVEGLMSASIASLSKDLDEKSQQLEKNALDVLKAVSAEMNKDDFELKLRLPILKPISIEFSSHKLLDDVVEKVTRLGECRPPLSLSILDILFSSFYGRINADDFIRKFDSVVHYKVNIKKIREQTLDGVRKMFTNANQSLEMNIIKPVESSCSEFFIELNETIDEILGDLQAELNDSNRTKAEQDDLASKLVALKLENLDSTGDMEQLKSDTSVLLGVKVDDMAVTV